ncbi:MAG TPA: hypothetical protein VI278_11575 [Nitrososphaeraceae archaeon]
MLVEIVVSSSAIAKGEATSDKESPSYDDIGCFQACNENVLV